MTQTLRMCGMGIDELGLLVCFEMPVSEYVSYEMCLQSGLVTRDQCMIN